MELKPGYKETDLGPLPSDWTTAKLEEVGLVVNGLTYAPSDVRSYGTLVLRSSNIQNDALAFEDNVFVDMEIPERIMVQPDDVLICVRNGSRILIGKTALLDERTIGMAFGAFMAVFRSDHGRYVNYLFRSHIMKRQIDEHLGATINQITNKSLKSFQIPVPPTDDEIDAIATALSDVDALLDGLDRLTAKKRDLKQAAMQQLLTGKTRLPGFEGEWEVRALSDVCWFQEGPGVRNYQFTNSGVKLFNGTNIEDGRIDLDKTNRFISEKEAYGWYSHFLADAGDIVIACSGVTIEKFEQKVSVIEEAHLPICMNTSTMRFKVLSAKLHNQFLLQFLRSSQFKQQIGGSATGSAQLNFGPSHVQKVFIDLPILEEQTAIATVLSDMDAEIAAVEQRRNKTKNIKQAMMQELLTGKTRLVTPGGSNA